MEAEEQSGWAGLKTFAPDRLPVYGSAPESLGVFWCAGQGGFGIRTAPAASRLAAALLLLGREPEFDPAAYLAARFGN
jgi:D-arginine dehydrogenase